jgi:pimeloyl-ACP methyl ester carboxylesterase
MPKCLINGIDINYQLDGDQGEVLVILNGIMMSTASWAEFVPVYTNRGYRVLRVDFRDQGQSGRAKEQYDISQHVEDLEQLFLALNLGKVHLHGISYGGQVALLFALKYQERLQSLVVANTIARLTNYLRGVGEAWDEAARMMDGRKFFRVAMPMVYSDVFYSKKWQWLKEREELFAKILTPQWFEAYLRLSASHGNFDILEQLGQIRVPTLLIASDRDPVTPVEEMKLIREGIGHAKMVIIPDAGHASCYEKPEEYNTLILGFLALGVVVKTDM